MGLAKAALRFGSSTILEHLFGQLEAVSDEVIVMAAPLSDETFSIDKLFGAKHRELRILRDKTPFAGPVPALISGLHAARNPVVFVCSCDLPLLRGEIAATLCRIVGDYEVAAPEIGGRLQPLCAAYKKDVAVKIEELWRAGESRVTAIVEGLSRRQVSEAEMRSVDPDLRSFLNLNTPEDYQRALTLAGLKA